MTVGTRWEYHTSLASGCQLNAQGIPTGTLMIMAAYISCHCLQSMSLATGAHSSPFLEKDLKQASGKYHFIVVVGHRPLLSSHHGFGKDKDPLSTGQWEAWQPLFEQYGVDLTLWGHVHAYERAMGNGIPVITSGMAGQSYCCGAWDYNPPNWSIFREDSHGYLRVNVDLTSNQSEPASMHVEYVRSDDGKVYDSFKVLSKRGTSLQQSVSQAQLWHSEAMEASNLSSYRRQSACYEELGTPPPPKGVVPVVPPGLCPKSTSDKTDIEAVLV